MSRKHLITILILSSFSIQAIARQWITLNDVITIAAQRSFSAKSARLRYVANYWTYRSFKAQLLPSVNLNGNLLGFDHSQVEARNSENGLISYVNNNSLTNRLTLSIDQEIPSTGGIVSLQSYLYRLDQFNYDLTTYNSQPLRISYTQPLRAYSALKWEKKTAPVEYEKACKEYLENMEDVTIAATSLFFSTIMAQNNYKQSVQKHKDLLDMYRIAQKRFELGTTTKSEMLQLELSMLNAKVEVTNNRLTLDDKKFNLFSFLRLSEYQESELIAPTEVPDIAINVEEAVNRALENSTHRPEQDLTILQARQAVAKAKAQRGIKLQLNSEIGFNKTDATFRGVYSRLQDNEVIGLTLSMPIFDWGVSKGKVHMAEANLELANVQVAQEREEYVQKIRKLVLQFTCRAEQCQIAQRAKEISGERYEITKQRFETGNITVTDLNTAMQEAETARVQYISQLQTYWNDYYQLRRNTLYDWQKRQSINTDFDKLLTRSYND